MTLLFVNLEVLCIFLLMPSWKHSQRSDPAFGSIVSLTDKNRASLNRFEIWCYNDEKWAALYEQC